MDPQIWNLLHDGTIASAAGHVPGDVSLSIRIPYIREMFAGQGKGEDGGLSILLHNCANIRLEPNVGSPIEELEAIGAASLWILSAEPAEPLIVRTGGGNLVLAYERASLLLDSGEPITVGDLDDASKKYWTGWEARVRNGAAP